MLKVYRIVLKHKMRGSFLKHALLNVQDLNTMRIVHEKLKDLLISTNYYLCFILMLDYSSIKKLLKKLGLTYKLKLCLI